MTDDSKLIVLTAPGRYVQGPNAIDSLGSSLSAFGDTAVVVADDTVWALVAERVTASLSRAGIEVERVAFSGECSESQIAIGLEAVARTTAACVVGIGGGKAADAAKSVGARADIRWATVVTVASSDGPASSASVIYTDEGEVARYEFHGRNPDLVLVDSQIVAQAPSRYLASGMADAVSTRWEASAAAARLTPTVAGGRPSHAALALAELAWINCRDHGEAALDAVDRNVVTGAVELIIETNTIHSCIGFESGGFSGAHAIHNGLSILPELHGALHGEKVNVGLLTQLVLESRPIRELEELAGFSDRLGLPLTLAELGATSSPQLLRQVAEVATAEGESIHWMPRPYDAEDVAAALSAADAFGERWREDHVARSHS
jgi:glycerol dehydrogenase